MKRMSEEEFDKLSFHTPPEKCPHTNVVKLYILGAHSDYGCEECGVKDSRIEFFRNKNRT